MTFRAKLTQALLAFLFAFLPITVCSGQEKVRVWKSTDGKFSVKAELVENLNGSVSLKRTSDGTVIKVPVAKLSAEDQAYLSSAAPAVKKTVGPPPTKLKSGAPFPTGLKEINKALLEKSLVLASGKFSLTTEKDFTPTFNDSFGYANRLQQIALAVDSLKRDKHFAESKLQSQNERSRMREGKNMPGGFPSVFPDVDEASIKKIDEEIAALCEASSEEFKRYYSSLGKARKHADKILGSYSQLEADSEVMHLIDAHNKASGKSYTLGASRQFEKDLARFKKLESAVIVQKFPIRKEENTIYATVNFRGKNVEMVVDPTWEQTISPNKLMEDGDRMKEMERARKKAMEEHFKKMGMEGMEPGRMMGMEAGRMMGMETGRTTAGQSSSGDAVIINKPDGSSLKGRRVKHFSRISLGNFVITNLVILDPEFDDEPARLGGDFLREFNFELLEEEGQLKLMQLGYVPE